MSTTFEKRPVVHLNHDLLYHILQMNADMFVDRNALKTIRMASQVCRHWRDGILSMASLWAKLIDLSSLRGAADLWRDELMRRSGTSLLWIATPASTIWDDSTGIISFLSSVVDKNWNRIQKLVVKIDVVYFSPRHSGVPSLCTFLHQIFIPSTSPSVIPSPETSKKNMLLVPFLQTMLRYCANSLLEDINLICMLPGCTNCIRWKLDVDLTLNDLLDALAVASNLKHLRFDRPNVEKVSPPPSIVSMPNLLSMTLSSHLEPGAILLEHLELPPGCALKFRFKTEVTQYSELEDIYCPAVRKLSKLAGFFFRSRAPQMLLLDCSSHEIAFRDKTEAEDPGFDLDVYFKYSLDEGPLTYAHRVFLNAFSLPELSEVTEIRLRNLDYDAIGMFAMFLEELPSLEIISMPNESLSYYMKQHTDFFLPNLEFFIEAATYSEWD